jgi:hypothetical protein
MKSVQDKDFRSAVTEACFWSQDDLEFFDDDVIFMIAKGTAELAKRELYLVR